MDGRLTDFLQYDYAEARTIATTLLTASGGLLAGSLVFTEKFIGLQRRADARLWKMARLGLYAFAAAGFCSGGALIGNYASMVRLVRHYRDGIPDGARFAADIARQSGGMSLLFLGTGALMCLGLFCLLDAADIRHRKKPDGLAGSTMPAVGAELPKPVENVAVPITDGREREHVEADDLQAEASVTTARF